VTTLSKEPGIFQVVSKGIFEVLPLGFILVASMAKGNFTLE